MKSIAFATSLLLALSMGGMTVAFADTEANKKVVVDYMNMLFNEKNAAKAIERYADPNVYIQHNPKIPDGAEAMVKFLEALTQDNPDARLEVKRVIAEGDLVMLHHHLTLKPDEPGLAVVDIFRLKDNRVVEHWDVI